MRPDFTIYGMSSSHKDMAESDEDEELAALRQAALLSRKSQQDRNAVESEGLKEESNFYSMAKTHQVRQHQSSRLIQGYNRNAWYKRRPNSLKKGTMGRQNLIVINPVNSDGKDDESLDVRNNTSNFPVRSGLCAPKKKSVPSRFRYDESSESSDDDDIDILFKDEATMGTESETKTDSGPDSEKYDVSSTANTNAEESNLELVENDKVLKENDVLPSKALSCLTEEEPASVKTKSNCSSPCKVVGELSFEFDSSSANVHPVDEKFPCVEPVKCDSADLYDDRLPCEVGEYQSVHKSYSPGAEKAASYNAESQSVSEVCSQTEFTSHTLSLTDSVGLTSPRDDLSDSKSKSPQGKAVGMKSSAERKLSERVDRFLNNSMDDVNLLFSGDSSVDSGPSSPIKEAIVNGTENELSEDELCNKIGDIHQTCHESDVKQNIPEIGSVVEGPKSTEAKVEELNSNLELSFFASSSESLLFSTADSPEKRKEEVVNASPKLNHISSEESVLIVSLSSDESNSVNCDETAGTSELQMLEDGHRPLLTLPKNDLRHTIERGRVQGKGNSKLYNSKTRKVEDRFSGVSVSNEFQLHSASSLVRRSFANNCSSVTKSHDDSDDQLPTRTLSSKILVPVKDSDDTLSDDDWSYVNSPPRIRSTIYSPKDRKFTHGNVRSVSYENKLECDTLSVSSTCSGSYETSVKRVPVHQRLGVRKGNYLSQKPDANFYDSDSLSGDKHGISNYTTRRKAKRGLDVDSDSVKSENRDRKHRQHESDSDYVNKHKHTMHRRSEDDFVVKRRRHHRKSSKHKVSSHRET